jgi:hypothetical protein
MGWSLIDKDLGKIINGNIDCFLRGFMICSGIILYFVGSNFVIKTISCTIMFWIFLGVLAMDEPSSLVKIIPIWILWIYRIYTEEHQKRSLFML